MAGLWVTLIYAAATLALGWPALGGDFLVNPLSDQYGGFAYREYAAATLQAGEGFPQWNPYILGGIPYMAAQHGDIFYPTFILRMLIEPDAAMTWGFLIHIFLAGLFAYGFLRAWRFAFIPALTGGLAYMMSGQIASLVSPGHDGKLYVSALAPLLLWMIVRAIRDGKLWAYAVIALATGLSVLSPHYQMTYYLGVFAGAYTLWLAFRKDEDPVERRTAILRLGGALGAAILGMAIGAVQFAPFFEYLPYAARGVERGWDYATSYSHPPIEIINAYLPQFSGILENYSGVNGIKLHSDYMGAAALVLAGAAFGSKRRRGMVWFWGIASFFVLLVALGGHTPFYRLWYLLPMMSVVRAPSMIYFLLSLAVAVFAAIGLERILGGEKSRAYFLGWIGFGLVMALLASAGALTSIAETFALPQLAGMASENRESVMLGGWRSFLATALLVGAVLLWRANRIPLRVFVIAVPLIVGVDLWSVLRNYFRFSPPAEQLYAPDPAIDFLRSHSDSGRVLALPLGSQNMAFRDPLLGGDALMIHRIRASTGHQGNEVQRWVELAGAKSPAPPPNLVNPQWRRLTNTKYLLTNVAPQQMPDLNARLTLRVGPITNALGSTAYVYEFVEENPPAWVAPVYVEAPPEATYNTVLDPRFDIDRAALFDTTEVVEGASISSLPDPLEIPMTVERPDPEAVIVRLGAPAPEGSALLVSENWYPGWSATVDGAEVPAGRADYSFIGVPLPAGAREIRLSFTEPAYALGKGITFAALALCAVIAGLGILQERRRRA